MPEQIHDTIDSIYAAAIQPRQWPGAVQRIAGLHRGEYAALLTPSNAPADGGYIIPFNMSPTTLAEWPKHVDSDPWVAAAIRKNVVEEGWAGTGDELLPDDQLTASSFYRNFLAHVGIRWLLTGCVFSGLSSDMPFTVCAVYNPEGGLRFDQDSVVQHRMLLRHLSRALGAMYKLRDLEFKAATSIQALDRLPGAVALVGDRGHVIFANKAAHRIFALSDGLTLRSGHPLQDGLGWLKASAPGVQVALELLVRRTLVVEADTAPHFSQALSVQRPSGKRAFLVRSCPISRSVDFADCPVPAAGLLFLSDPDAAPRLDGPSLTRLYGLTAGELKVAQQLLTGEPVAEVAARLQLTEATVKTHIRRLFQKTGTSRQPQLVRLLLDLCA